MNIFFGSGSSKGAIFNVFQYIEILENKFAKKIFFQYAMRPTRIGVEGIEALGFRLNKPEVEHLYSTLNAISCDDIAFEVERLLIDKEKEFFWSIKSQESILQEEHLPGEYFYNSSVKVDIKGGDSLYINLLEEKDGKPPLFFHPLKIPAEIAGDYELPKDKLKLLNSFKGIDNPHFKKLQKLLENRKLSKDWTKIHLHEQETANLIVGVGGFEGRTFRCDFWKTLHILDESLVGLKPLQGNVIEGFWKCNEYPPSRVFLIKADTFIKLIDLIPEKEREYLPFPSSGKVNKNQFVFFGYPEEYLLVKELDEAILKVLLKGNSFKYQDIIDISEKVLKLFSFQGKSIKRGGELAQETLNYIRKRRRLMNF